MLRPKAGVIAALAACLIACYPQARPGRARIPIRVKQPLGSHHAGSRIVGYRIDPARSWLRVLVYRAGPLANLGHDHVVSNRALRGWLRLGESWTQSSFVIEVPVGDFVVDDEAERQALGGVFAAAVAPADRRGTRAHMLGPFQLDAAHHPLIRLRSLAIFAPSPRPAARVEVRVAGHRAVLDLPFTASAFAFSNPPAGIVARTAFELRQTRLGITPYQVMLGALRVRDRVEVQMSLYAVRSGSAEN
ncbi:MAG: YceI family protein [Gammaproteobacteria bacterium]|nr:YceI family protein [Gammaproteobacteria bacterium]